MSRFLTFSCAVIFAAVRFGVFDASAQDGTSTFIVEPPDPPRNGGSIEIIGGKPADTAQWSATYIFRNLFGEKKSCTATLIGDFVILTAAHCVDHGSTGQIAIRSSVKPPSKVTCFRHPWYDADSAAPLLANETKDFALCISAGSLYVSSLVPYFERISTSLMHSRVDRQIILLGFGCREKGGHDKKFGDLYLGSARIVGDSRSQNGAYMTTKADEGETTTCYGDSGGAVYFQSSGHTDRFVIGVNSGSNLVDISKFAATASSAFIDWALSWSAERNVKICGLHDDADHCREPQ